MPNDNFPKFKAPPTPLPKNATDSQKLDYLVESEKYYRDKDSNKDKEEFPYPLLFLTIITIAFMLFVAYLIK